MIDPKKLCQLEIHSTNLGATINFFAEVFEWPAVPIAIHDYTVLRVPDDSPFGVSIVSDRSRASSPGGNGVIPYFAYESNIEDLLLKVQSHGGRILWGPRPFPGYGQVYLLEAPGDIHLGIYISDTSKN